MISEASFEVATFVASESVKSLSGAKQKKRGSDFSVLASYYSKCLLGYKFSPAWEGWFRFETFIRLCGYGVELLRKIWKVLERYEVAA